MKKYLFILTFLFFNNLIFAQTDSIFVWENYLPKSEVDSIVILSTDTFEVKRSYEIAKMAIQQVKEKRKQEEKIRRKRILIEQSLKLHNDKAQRMLAYGKFDLNNYTKIKAILHFRFSFHLLTKTKVFGTFFSR